jgi:hypothetical protein
MTPKLIRQYANVPSLEECSRRIAEIRARKFIELYGGDATPEPVLTPAAQQRALEDQTEAELLEAEQEEPEAGLE